MDTQSIVRYSPRAWRQSARAAVGGEADPRLGAAGAGLGAILMSVVGVAVLLLDGNAVAWLGGLLAGGGAGATIASGRALSASRRRSAEPRAQDLTRAALDAAAAAGWRFWHELEGLDQTYDHVALGPGGMILLESFDRAGSVTMRGGAPVLERPAPGGGEPERVRLRPRALAGATALRDDLQRVGGRRQWVQAVVTLWCDFPPGCVTDGRCVYLHGSRLAEWLARRPQQLDEAQIQEIAARLDRLAERGRGGDLTLPVAA